VGYRLKKPTGEVYDLAADLSSCDCAHATFYPERPGGCKHRRALTAALASLGVQTSTPGRCPHCGAPLPRCEGESYCVDCARFKPAA
jgi:hypothetical protein